MAEQHALRQKENPPSVVFGERVQGVTWVFESRQHLAGVQEASGWKGVQSVRRRPLTTLGECGVSFKRIPDRVGESTPEFFLPEQRIRKRIPVSLGLLAQPHQEIEVYRVLNALTILVKSTRG